MSLMRFLTTIILYFSLQSSFVEVRQAYNRWLNDNSKHVDRIETTPIVEGRLGPEYLYIIYHVVSYANDTQVAGDTYVL